MQELEDFEPVQFRQLDVEEDDFGRQLSRRANGLEPVGALADNAQSANLRQVLARDRAREILVVDDEDADLGRAAGARAHAGICAGTEITTRYRSAIDSAANIVFSP